MTIDLSESGRLRLKGVSDADWMYIQTERLKNGDPDHWLVGRERYDGLVYITTTDYEDKTGIVRFLDGLKDRQVIEISAQANRLLAAWRNEAKNAMDTEARNARLEGRARYIKALQNVLKKGCKGCPHFHEELRGDDAVGLCGAHGEAYELESSPVSPNHGEWRKGEHYWGRKYYPCTKCKYITEEVK